jgi:hypothetical protein
MSGTHCGQCAGFARRADVVVLRREVTQARGVGHDREGIPEAGERRPGGGVLRREGGREKQNERAKRA